MIPATTAPVSKSAADGREAKLPAARLILRLRYALFCFMTSLLRLSSRIEVEGTENVPPLGPLMLVCNHINPLESTLWSLFGRADVWIVADARLRNNLLRRWLYGAFCNLIYVDRGEGIDGLVARAVPILAAGGVVMLSPEGKYSWNGVLGAGKSGAAALATRTGALVVPFVAWGLERLACDLRRRQRGQVTVRVGTPFRFANDAADECTITQRTNEIMMALAQMLPEQYRGGWRAG
jgi:1-acyl-sn-glycerol-3-phosphate acyltransferase